jgi:hypothetical protein
MVHDALGILRCSPFGVRHSSLLRDKGKERSMVDLSTTYMGLKLKNPIVPSASPLSASLDNIKRFEDSGAAAVTMYSLFEEQIELEAESLAHFLERGT